MKKCFVWFSSSRFLPITWRSGSWKRYTPRAINRVSLYTLRHHVLIVWFTDAWKSLTDKVQEARSNAKLQKVSFEGKSSGVHAYHPFSERLNSFWNLNQLLKCEKRKKNNRYACSYCFDSVRFTHNDQLSTPHTETRTIRDLLVMWEVAWCDTSGRQNEESSRRRRS